MTQRYLRFEVISLNEILSYVRTYWGEKKARIQRPSGKWVGVSSLRMRTFARAGTDTTGMNCVCCKLKAEFFAVEQSAGQSSYHLNLYGIKDGKEILFTHDHIKARSLGGADNLSNTQIMCSPCNSKKGEGERKEALRLRKLKETQNEKIDDKI